MIRDPSDGSVREKPKPVIDTGTSGLQTGSERPENVLRLEKSRQWLRDYLERKITHE